MHTSATHATFTRGSKPEKEGERKTYRVSSLDKDGSRTGKLAHQAFARRQARDQAARRDALEDILGVPSDEVPVVDNVLFAIHELRNRQYPPP